MFLFCTVLAFYHHHSPFIRLPINDFILSLTSISTLSTLELYLICLLVLSHTVPFTVVGTSPVTKGCPSSIFDGFVTVITWCPEVKVCHWHIV